MGALRLFGGRVAFAHRVEIDSRVALQLVIGRALALGALEPMGETRCWSLERYAMSACFACVWVLYYAQSVVSPRALVLGSTHKRQLLFVDAAVGGWSSYPDMKKRPTAGC